MRKIKDYSRIVGPEVIAEICRKAKKFENKRIVVVSSTHQGGGVAEMLNSIVLLFNDIGINFGWRIIHGSPDFFYTTKSFHNGLQGEDIKITTTGKKNYLETNERYAVFTHLTHDLVIVHDPQPLALIDYYKRKQPWVWRCHIDLTEPNKRLWNFLKKYISKYDAMVVSTECYKKKDLSIDQCVIHPAIDPLSDKNREMSTREAESILHNLEIDTKKPIITQISRYDHWKDPEGVVKIYEQVKKKANCQLVLLGNTATDDPEGVEVFGSLKEKYDKKKDIKLLVNVENNDLVVNALQRSASVVIQKSTREGFALTVSEALYKGTPVVASNIGGIPLQITHGQNGYLHDPLDYKGFSESITNLLKNDKLREGMGENAHQFAKENFLITRLMNDWLDLFKKYI